METEKKINRWNILKIVRKTTATNVEGNEHTCIVRLIDDTDRDPISISYKRDQKGDWLFNHVCEVLELVEKDYFGLRYVDSEKQRHWLDPTKSIYKQLKGINQAVLCFRVKFYPSDPMKLKEEITRRYLFLQLRRDLLHGRLLCSPADAIFLAAHIIQAEAGDFDESMQGTDYVAEFMLLPNQTPKQNEKIQAMHKTLGGLRPSEAESSFLTKASSLETYGVDPHPVKDQQGTPMYMGMTHLGIVTFQGNKRAHLLRWEQINKIVFEGKMLIIHITVSEKKVAVGFKSQTLASTKHLWRCAVEQQYFFTLRSMADGPKVVSAGGFLIRSSRIRLSGRCQEEVFQSSATLRRDGPLVKRSNSNPNFFSHHASLLRKKRKDSFDADEYFTNLSSSTSCIPSASGKDGVDGAASNVIAQKSVEIAETSYQPQHSPTSEAAPPFPRQNQDLDGQIDYYQRELRDLTESSPDGKVKANGRQAPKQVAMGYDEELTEDDSAAEKPKGSCWPTFFTILFILLLVAAVAFAFFLFESERDLPVVKGLRQKPRIVAFKQAYYAPLREYVVRRVGRLVKRFAGVVAMPPATASNAAAAEPPLPPPPASAEL